MTDLVLMVEDNRDDETLILRALRKFQLAPRVVVAHDGVEAIMYLRRMVEEPEAPLPNVVFLDLNLPRIGGLEVLKVIRAEAKTRRIPVVVMTSSREERDVADAYDLGATSYVRKPIGSEQFIDVIRQVGSYWLQVNEPPPSFSVDRPEPDGRSAVGPDPRS